MKRVIAMMSKKLTRNVELAVERVRQHTDLIPIAAVILGSGLGGLAQCIEQPTVIPFQHIPGFKRSSAAGHRGELILGHLESRPVVAMAGRIHRYEGWSEAEIVFPVQVMAALGAQRLIVSNAAGGVSPRLAVGDIVILRDHIRWFGGFGGGGANHDRGCDLYDPAMSSVAHRAARESGFNAWPGTYLATLGPNYETRSEYRMMRRIGADVVGMSTVDEVLAAGAEKMRVLGLSMVSNVANPDSRVVADHTQVLQAGQAAAAKLEAIVRGVLRA
jgi:purine-nucleoside phosphorylase